MTKKATKIGLIRRINESWYSKMSWFPDFSARLRDVYLEEKELFRLSLDKFDIAEEWRNKYLKNERTMVEFRCLEHIFTEDDARRLQAMTYEHFLDNQYWHIVSDYVKIIEDNQCSWCNKLDYHSELHHNSYEHHGWEHQYIDKDLELLCQSCHRKVHPQPINRYTLSLSRELR